MWVMGVEPESSVRAATALNHWPSSPSLKKSALRSTMSTQCFWRSRVFYLSIYPAVNQLNISRPVPYRWVGCNSEYCSHTKAKASPSDNLHDCLLDLGTRKHGQVLVTFYLNEKIPQQNNLRKEKLIFVAWFDGFSLLWQEGAEDPATQGTFHWVGRREEGKGKKGLCQQPFSVFLQFKGWCHLHSVQLSPSLLIVWGNTLPEVCFTNLLGPSQPN